MTYRILRKSLVHSLWRCVANSFEDGSRHFGGFGDEPCARCVSSQVTDNVLSTYLDQGTATLEDLDGRTQSMASLYNVKRSKDGIILVPQPSDDPQDPLVSNGMHCQTPTQSYR